MSLKDELAKEKLFSKNLQDVIDREAEDRARILDELMAKEGELSEARRILDDFARQLDRKDAVIDGLNKAISLIDEMYNRF
jgi:hypothetical protein